MAPYTRLQTWAKQHITLCSIVVLFIFALASRLIGIAHPESAVFDEVHFNYFAHFYYTGQYFYDIHPPLGKLLIALSAWPFGGIAAEDVVRTISSLYPNQNYIALRTLPTIFGSLLPLLIYLICREFKISQAAAFIAGAFCALDNALLLQTKFILLDAMLLGFGFSALWLFLVARRKQSTRLLMLAAALTGCSFSVKWIGVSFLGLIGLMMIVDWVKAMLKRGWQTKPFLQGIAFLLVAFGVYLFTFALHFALLPTSHKQGDQFMSYDFRSTLIGSEYAGVKRYVTGYQCPEDYRHNLRYGLPEADVKPVETLACKPRYKSINSPGFFGKLFELNRVMYTSNQGLSEGHPDASPWYSWPIMMKPLYYWHHDGARIYLLGNPAVWWLCSLGVLVLLIGQFWAPFWRNSEAFWWLSIGFWSSLLPFMFVSRVMFLYHYLTGLCFSIMLAAYLIDTLPKRRWTTLSLIASVFMCFLLVSPLTYGVNWYGSDMLWFLRFFGWHP